MEEMGRCPFAHSKVLGGQGKEVVGHEGQGKGEESCCDISWRNL